MQISDSRRALPRGEAVAGGAQRGDAQGGVLSGGRGAARVHEGQVEGGFRDLRGVQGLQLRCQEAEGGARGVLQVTTVGSGRGPSNEISNTSTVVDKSSEGETAIGNTSDTVGSGRAVWGHEGGTVAEIPKGEETVCVVPEIFEALTVGVEIHHIDTDIEVYDVQWGGEESGNIDDVENPPEDEEKSVVNDHYKKC